MCLISFDAVKIHLFDTLDNNFDHKFLKYFLCATLLFFHLY
nr:MAG TPA: hypothetical protein [Caudoviricetes sp.]